MKKLSSKTEENDLRALDVKVCIESMILQHIISKCIFICKIYVCIYDSCISIFSNGKTLRLCSIDFKVDFSLIIIICLSYCKFSILFSILFNYESSIAYFRMDIKGPVHNCNFALKSLSLTPEDVTRKFMTIFFVQIFAKEKVNPFISAIEEISFPSPCVLWNQKSV